MTYPRCVQRHQTVQVGRDPDGERRVGTPVAFIESRELAGAVEIARADASRPGYAGKGSFPLSPGTKLASSSSIAPSCARSSGESA